MLQPSRTPMFFRCAVHSLICLLPLPGTLFFSVCLADIHLSLLGLKCHYFQEASEDSPGPWSPPLSTPCFLHPSRPACFILMACLLICLFHYTTSFMKAVTLSVSHAIVNPISMMPGTEIGARNIFDEKKFVILIFYYQQVRTIALWLVSLHWAPNLPRARRPKITAETESDSLPDSPCPDAANKTFYNLLGTLRWGTGRLPLWSYNSVYCSGYSRRVWDTQTKLTSLQVKM